VTPTEPGFYWMRDPGAPWTIAELYDLCGEEPRVVWMHRDWGVPLDSQELAAVEWGPRIEPPP
jgi:hypothetical protein